MSNKLIFSVFTIMLIMSAFFYLPSNLEKNQLFLNLNKQTAQATVNLASVNLVEPADMMTKATFNYVQSQLENEVVWPTNLAFSEYLIQLGNKAQMDERKDDAQKYYKNALNLDTRRADKAWLGIGQVAASKGDFKEAISAYNNAITVGSLDCELYVSMAETQVKLKAWEDAIHAFQEVVKTQKACRYGDGYIWYRMGSIYQHRLSPQDIEKAWNAYDKAQESSDFRPNNWLDGDVHWQRGLILLEKQEIDKAEAEFTKAVTLRPKQYLAWVELIKVHHIKGNWALAEEVAETAIVLDPNRHQAYRALGDLYVETDRIEEARKAYQKVLSIQPNNEYAQNRLQELAQ